ncbi:MAG: TonB-dependent receptor [Cyclobacteriaceae bacterium]|nr:TonB-dependent receptor [Cyclobacteriaceae bacterium]
MTLLLRLTAILAFTFISFNSFSQRKELITDSFDSILFEEFAKRIENKTSYNFYYNPAQVDSLVVTLKIENELMTDVLNRVFAGTDFRFVIDKENNIFITKGREILGALPEDFFSKKPDGVKQQMDFDLSDYEKKEKKKNQVESKLYSIGIKTSNLQGSASIAGYVRNALTGEPVIGASIFVENPVIGVGTDAFGYYSITLPKGRHTLNIKSIGIKPAQRQIMLYSDGKLDIEVEEDVTPLKEVIVESDRDVRVTGMQMGLEKLDIKTMKQMPSALGEVDVLKVMLALPGVQSVGEGANGINVRGGATNQNLILFNDATVYNPSHLFGFFSTFNPDILKSVELYKSGITADYGGRLSSVLDVKTREGNLKKFSGSGGISPITGRLTLEGPIIKDKTSLILSGRSTYSDWLLRQIDSPELKNSTASFYDVNAILTHQINDKNNLYASVYLSKDKFSLNSDTLYSYSDRNASLKWRHSFNNKLYSVFTAGASEYKYDISSDNNPVNAFTLDFAVQQLNAKADFSFFQNQKNTITTGVSTTHYKLWPGNQQPNGSTSIITPDVLEPEQGLESAIYIGDNYEVNSKLSIYIGTRYSLYQYLGPKKVYQYASNLPLEERNTIDSTFYDKGETITTYHGLEPRLSLRYILPRNSSVKLSYNRMRQYIQMLSNTTAIAPTDIWKLSDPYIRPQIGDQISIGYYKNIGRKQYETSAEVYYKITQQALDFKGGAVLLLNHQIETDVIEAFGKAYGIELMLKKATGKLNGWITYTYSRSLLQTRNPYPSETINGGKFFPSNYDKPHAANFIGNYKFSRRVNFSLNVTYSTGRPLTIPLGQYELNGSKRLYYSDRNQFRIPDYFRVDASLNFEGNHKIKKLAHSSWTLAVYNLTGRDNAYSIFFESKDGTIQGYKLSVFAQPIPTLTYNFRF